MNVNTDMDISSYVSGFFDIAPCSPTALNMSLLTRFNSRVPLVLKCRIQ